MYVLALYWKGDTRAGAVSNMVTGVFSSIFWMLFIHASTSGALRISNFIFGVDTILPYPWNAIDPIFIAFPLAFIVTFIVSLFTKKLPAAIIEKSFAAEKQE